MAAAQPTVMMSTAKKAFGAFAIVSLLIAAGSMVGCGNGGSDEVDRPVDLAGFVKQGPTLDLAMVCISSCETDEQCQNTCAPPSSGISCCDTGTSACFTSQTTACPAPQDLSTAVGPY
jgi:hypothetical protein